MSTRSVARAMIPLGIAGVVVAAAASPAFAATTINISGSHLSGGELTQNDTITIAGSGSAPDPSGLSKARTVELSVRTAANGTYTFDSTTVPSNRASQLTANLDTGCAPWSGCAPAANGSYTFVFTDGTRSASRSVTLAIPPATPGGFTAHAAGTVGTFDWTAGSEPDIAGYEVLDGGHDITNGGVSPQSVCDASGCELSVDFGSDVRGTTHSFSVVALRHTAPHSSSTLSSSPSAERSVTFQAAPSPSDSPSSDPGSGGGGTGGGAGGSGGTGGTGGTGGSGGSDPGTTGGTGATHGTTGGTTAHHATGTHRAPAADLARSLPTLHAAAAPDLPSVLTEVKPLPEGTYKPKLPYNDQVVREAIHKPLVSAAGPGVTQALQKVFDSTPLWRGLGGAAVLFLVAAHLHAWVRRTDLD